MKEILADRGLSDVSGDMTRKGSRMFYYDCKTRTITRRSEDDKNLVIGEQDKGRFDNILNYISKSDEPLAYYAKLSAEDRDGDMHDYNIGFVCSDVKEKIIITLTHSDTLCSSEHTIDALTGLYNRNGFSLWIEQHKEIFQSSEEHKTMVVYFDVQRFKMVNELYGLQQGDRLLKHIGNVLGTTVLKMGYGAGCHMDSDRFVFVVSCLPEKMNQVVEDVLDEIASFDLPFEITCNAGIYVMTENYHSADTLIDRAIMAQSVIKGSYTTRYSYYTDKMREELVTEQEIIGMMRAGIQNEEFVLYYQPQYNHETGMLIGAEALVRWKHAEKGLISPGVFIPVFEKNGFITKLDLYVFEKVCRFLRTCMCENIPIVPISINLTRYDIFYPNFIEMLEDTRRSYGVPPEYIRVEITESVALGNSHFINEAMRKLYEFGYVVEMDDFGSGYSSLNILKDIDFDVIKLDMKFLEKEEDESKRGGTILSSVVRMVNWLGLPMIAEGVETINQADFLKSIGCNYIQGYLYSKPLPEEEYKNHLLSTKLGTTIPRMKLTDALEAVNFLSNDSLETLIFSNFVGGAAIFEFKNGEIEILRVNEKYLVEFGMNLTQKEVVESDFLSAFDDNEKATYLNMLERAIETEEEQECETWRNISSGCYGNETLCIRSAVRVIGKSKDTYLFYAMVRNITAEKKRLLDLVDTEKRLEKLSEQASIYYWEYTVATKEMRPCYRCMRDMGLPALVKNYPDTAIEMGVFPEEVADMYRDWHRQIAEGVPYLEAVIPMTVGKIPFMVRYTTEFDENNRPIKAYGSATLWMEEKM